MSKSKLWDSTALRRTKEEIEAEHAERIDKIFATPEAKEYRAQQQLLLNKEMDYILEKYADDFNAMSKERQEMFIGEYELTFAFRRVLSTSLDVRLAEIKADFATHSEYISDPEHYEIMCGYLGSKEELDELYHGYCQSVALNIKILEDIIIDNNRTSGEDKVC